MPHNSFKLLPGVDQNKTPTLNEAAISESQLIRFIPDRTLGGLVQKLGGWTKFFPNTIGSTIRALWAWKDTNAYSYLAVGAEGASPIPVTGASGNGVTATLTYAGPFIFRTGNGITVYGVGPSDYNGQFTVTASTSSSVSFASTTAFSPKSATGASGDGSTATITFSGSYVFDIGGEISVSGMVPSAYNGQYVVTSSSAGSVSFSSAASSAYVSGGVISYVPSGYILGGGGTLQVIESGGANDITPQKTTVNVAVSVSTTSGSNVVTITDTGRNADDYDVVDIQTQISVGGLVLFGQYQTSNPGGSANTYTILATNVLGEPQYATATVTTSGSVAEYDTTNGSNFVDVTLANHGYFVGSTYTALVATSLGGVTLYGNYIVIEITSSSVFVISASTAATATTSAFQNSSNAHYVYYNGLGPIPAGSGYGIGGYGEGGYGTGTAPTAGTGTPINATDWTLDNWGEVLISSPVNGPIYKWSPTSGDQTALIIPNAPSVNDGCFVAMPQRQIIAWGSTFTGVKDPLLIRWCDVNDYDQWIGLITNQAGSYRIPKGSRVVQCIQGPQQGLVWTDLAIWSMQYAGPPYVYQFNELGTGCGLIGRRAAAPLGGVVYWMGQSQFYRLAGSGVEPIACPVWDVIFQDLDENNLDKIRVAPNSRFGEITWYYPTMSNGGEVSHYVKFNTILNQWDFGVLSRTAWINESVLGPPIGAAPNTYIYQHETSPDADGTAMVSSFQTGYFVLTEADVKMFVDQVWPDMKWGYYGGVQNANVLLTFFVADYPGDTPITYGPFNLTEATKFITPRFRGRLVSIKIESSDIGSWWRLGNIRYRFQPDGKY